MSSFFWIEFFLDRGDFRIPTFSACPPSLLPYERMCLAIPGKIVSLHDAQGVKMAKVDFGGVFREACLEYLPEAALGDYVMVHVGFAISRVDEEEAARTYQILREMNQLAELGAGEPPEEPHEVP